MEHIASPFNCQGIPSRGSKRALFHLFSGNMPSPSSMWFQIQRGRNLDLRWVSLRTVPCAQCGMLWDLFCPLCEALKGHGKEGCLRVCSFINGRVAWLRAMSLPSRSVCQVMFRSKDLRGLPILYSLVSINVSLILCH